MQGEAGVNGGAGDLMGGGNARYCSGCGRCGFAMVEFCSCFVGDVVRVRIGRGGNREEGGIDVKGSYGVGK